MDSMVKKRLQAFSVHGGENLVVPKRLKRGRLGLLRGSSNKTSKILEIGPLFVPVAAKRDGFNVFIVDKFSKEDLEKNYAYINKRANEIEEVDFVWGNGKLEDFIPHEHHGTFDTIIMSHVLEHSPDPIAMLKSCGILLKKGGSVTLALPDKRYCFDAFRPVTTTGAWIEAFRSQREVHTRQTLFESSCNAVARDYEICWLDDAVTSTKSLTFVTKALADAYHDYYNSGPITEYSDCHAWVFTPASFALIAHETYALRLSPLTPTMITKAFQGEFLVHLTLMDKEAVDHHDRMHLMALSAAEQAKGYRTIVPGKRRMFSGDWFRYLLSPLSFPRIRARFR